MAIHAFTSSILGRHHLQIFATQNYLQSGRGLIYIWRQWSIVNLCDTRHYLESRTFTVGQSDMLYLEWLVHRRKVSESKVWLSGRPGCSLSISCWGRPDTLLFDWLLCWEECVEARGRWVSSSVWLFSLLPETAIPAFSVNVEDLNSSSYACSASTYPVSIFPACPVLYDSLNMYKVYRFRIHASCSCDLLLLDLLSQKS